MIAARTALDQVAREGEGRPGEPDQRDLELADQRADRLERVWLVDLGLERTETVEVARGSDRLIQYRSAAGFDPEGDPGRDERHHDVAEHDRGVERHPAERLERDLDGLVRDPDRLEDVAVATELAVFRKVAARLSHEPDRCPVDGFSTERAEQTVGRRGHAPQDTGDLRR